MEIRPWFIVILKFYYISQRYIIKNILFVLFWTVKVTGSNRVVNDKSACSLVTFA